MKIIKTMKSVSRYPISIIALSIIFLFVATKLFWFGFYSSAEEDNAFERKDLRKTISQIDHQRRTHNKLFKKLEQANTNILYANRITTQNKTRIKLLNKIMKLSENSIGAFSLLSNKDDKITIELKPKELAKFYELIKIIESQKYVDRITLIKNNKKQILTIYIRHSQKDWK